MAVGRVKRWWWTRNGREKLDMYFVSFKINNLFYHYI